jgi:hypothetical protein
MRSGPIQALSKTPERTIVTRISPDVHFGVKMERAVKKAAAYLVLSATNFRLGRILSA